MGHLLTVPVLGFCGHSGSGKTTIIENVVPRLVKKGLAVGFLKHDAHRLAIDHEGKDTDRIFKSGVSAIAAVSDEELFTRIRVSPGGGVEDALEALAHCDIVLAEGYKNAPWEKIWVHPHSGAREAVPPLDKLIYEIGGAASLQHRDIDVLIEIVSYWLVRQFAVKPLYGGLLVGGKSARMGTPKAMLPAEEGLTLSEKLYGLLEKRTQRVYLLGTGPLPESLCGVERIADHPGSAGPLAGLLSAHGFAPWADWLILPVDMPGMTDAYLARLASMREPAARFIGAQDAAGAVEPLGALYSSQLLHRITLSSGDERSINRILSGLGVKGRPELYDAAVLRNVNTKEDL